MLHLFIYLPRPGYVVLEFFPLEDFSPLSSLRFLTFESLASMKFTYLSLVAAATAVSAICPMGKQAVEALKARDEVFQEDVKAINSLQRRQLGAAGTFSESQRIDVTGEHAYQPPGPGDLWECL